VLTFLAGTDKLDIRVNGINASDVMETVCEMFGIDANDVRSEAKEKGLCVMMHCCTAQHEFENGKRKMI
jgi:hypothetical protein